MYKDQNQLIKALTAENLLTEKAAGNLKKEAVKAKKTPEELILAGNLVPQDKLLEVKSKLLKIPAADLRGKRIPREILSLIPKGVAENYRMVAFEKIDKEFHVGLVNPQDFKAIEVVEFLAQKVKLKAKYFVISPDSLKFAFNQYEMLAEEAKEALVDIGEKVEVEEEKLEDVGEMEAVVKRAPVSKMVLVIIKHALTGRASDIHIEPTTKDTQVRYRIDGILRTSLVLPKYIHAAVVARIKVLSNLKLDETRKPQDGRIRLTIEGRNIDFRVSTLPLSEGEKVVLRILDPSAQVPDLEKLGFNSFHVKLVEEAVKKPHGLILLTGPTGSGKTTTLYAVLTMLNQEGTNIIALEDPIEYYIDGVNQSQIRPEIGYSFASGLRAILRQDPNIVMVGEIRDKETTQLVIHASLTGHLILSTLHTNSAIGAIPRLIDMGAEPFLLSSVINLVIAQRLARKICPGCKKKVAIPGHLQVKITKQLSGVPPKYLEGVDLKKLTFWKGEGCALCANLGYQGRIASTEVFEITPELRKMIAEGGKNTDLIKEVLAKQDFITLMQDCLIKALKGVTTLDEVMRITQL